MAVFILFMNRSYNENTMLIEQSKSFEVKYISTCSNTKKFFPFAPRASPQTTAVGLVCVASIRETRLLLRDRLNRFWKCFEVWRRRSVPRSSVKKNSFKKFKINFVFKKVHLWVTGDCSTLSRFVSIYLDNIQCNHFCRYLHTVLNKTAWLALLTLITFVDF